MMEHLSTPWRYEYVVGGTKEDGCLFCRAAADDPANDETHLVLHRGERNFVIINKYPYTNGHLMVAPFAHVADLRNSAAAQLTEMMGLAKTCEKILSEAYHPDGFNIGMNIGKAAGAGVADHQHLHIVPRWLGDASFMTTTASTRVVPEAASGTFARLRPAFDQLGSPTE